MARRRRLLAVAVVLIVSVAALALALSLGGHHSGGDYARFADCPLGNPATDVCIYAQTESGALIIGRRTIPITSPIILLGGIHQNEATGKQEFIGAEGGDTLSRPPQTVPGGLLELVAPKLLPTAVRERFYRFIDQGSTKLTATVELAAPAHSIRVSTQDLIEAKGVGLSLPVKVKLSNPFLGAVCYIGSNVNPIVIPLTTGTTSPSPLHQPRTGKPGHARFQDDYNLITIKEDSLISNSFAAPRVEGCGGGLASLVDPAIDAKLGVPIAAGYNEATLNGTLLDANAAAVKEADRAASR